MSQNFCPRGLPVSDTIPMCAFYLESEHLVLIHCVVTEYREEEGQAVRIFVNSQRGCICIGNITYVFSELKQGLLGHIRYTHVKRAHTHTYALAQSWISLKQEPQACREILVQCAQVFLLILISHS